MPVRSISTLDDRRVAPVAPVARRRPRNGLSLGPPLARPGAISPSGPRQCSVSRTRRKPRPMTIPSRVFHLRLVGLVQKKTGSSGLVPTSGVDIYLRIYYVQHHAVTVWAGLRQGATRSELGDIGNSLVAPPDDRCYRDDGRPPGQMILALPRRRGGHHDDNGARLDQRC